MHWQLKIYISLLIRYWDWVQGGNPLFAAVKCLSGNWPVLGTNMQRWPKQIQLLPQTWLYQPLDQKLKIPLKWNMKSSQNKSSSALPQIWLSKRSTLKLSVSFQALCDKVKWKPDAADKSPCTWEGWAVVSAQFGDQEVTQFGLYFFCIHAQGVVAAVSVFVNSIQTEQILRRFAVYKI